MYNVYNRVNHYTYMLSIHSIVIHNCAVYSAIKFKLYESLAYIEIVTSDIGFSRC